MRLTLAAFGSHDLLAFGAAVLARVAADADRATKLLAACGTGAVAGVVDDGSAAMLARVVPVYAADGTVMR
jgi:hypothetical protein